MELKEIIKQALVEAIMETCSTMLSAVPVIKERNERGSNIFDGDNIVASIGFMGKLSGTFMVIVSKDSACKMVSKMLGCNLGQVNQEVFDGVGEIANIALGCVKSRSATDNYEFEVSVPSVIGADKKVEIAKVSESEVMGLSVDCADLRFNITFSYIVDGRGDKSGAKLLKDKKAFDAEKAIKDLLK